MAAGIFVAGMSGGNRKAKLRKIRPMGLVTAPPGLPVPPERTLDRALEEGHIVFFPESPVELPASEREFLLAQRQTRAGYHKNIAYRPRTDRLTGYNGDATRRVREILRGWSRAVVRFLGDAFPEYARGARLDYASFRPLEEAGRHLATHSRNDLLHVDAFPTRPTRGDRIFRFFTNINLSAARVWATGETFEELAVRFAKPSGILNRVARGGVGRALRPIARLLRLPGSDRSPYDEFMIRFHHFLKENSEYQAASPKTTIAFPPGSSWMVYTDMVSHLVLSGQYALEQTFILARGSMAEPEKAPIAILEKIAGVPLS
jgi:hypothetical protein